MNLSEKMLVCNEPLILLYPGRSIISGLIRWQTRSQYSHAAVAWGKDLILEAVEGQGVIQRKILPIDETADVYRVNHYMREHEWAAALKFGQTQIGKGYDYRAVLRFVSRRAADENDKWFCSELVFAMLQAGEVSLLSRIEAANVSPALLSFSSSLKKVN